MSDKKPIIGLVGSPQKDGRTNELVSAALDGAAKAGATVEKIQMVDHRVGPCRDCLPWICKDELKCTFKDANFDLLADKVLNCGGLILGTPVYWWDTSALVKFFILKMFRVFARTGPHAGLPALGIGIAGGTGNGLVSGLRPVYHLFQMLQMHALEPIPATRFNFSQCLDRSAQLGAEMAVMADNRRPFATYEDRLNWYDNLAYINLDRAGERRLLADLTVLGLPEEKRGPLAAELLRADALAAAGRTIEAMQKTTAVYNQAVEIFDRLETAK